MDKFSNNDYKDFSESDFISDSYFQDWIISPTEENRQYWNAFLLSCPEKKDVVENARFFLTNLKFKTEFPEDARIQELFAQHLEAIEGSQGAKLVSLDHRRLRKISKIAAVIGGIALLVWALFLTNKKPGDAVIATNYGELKQITLPDSTHIVLNAHSTIKYLKKWNKNAPREVWLDGEAFFDVKHLNKNPAAVQSGERFLVHVNDLSIEVLGTSFNVRERRGKTEVVLQSGKIRLSVKDKEIIMQPGDWVVYNPVEKSIVRSETNPENYSAWKERKLILNNPTVEEIVQYLEDSFGKKIELENASLRTKKIEGPILLNNLDDALFVISTVLNVKVEQRDSVLILHSK